ncbi:MAG: PEP/pyruvate-binding domain-containing protein [Vicinamibacterales bacterium]
MTIVPLRDAADAALFGGKAASLSAALRAGLPVPPGIALSSTFTARVAAGDDDALAALRAQTFSDARLAVRSSAIGEDSSGASFAGQHATRLNVRPADVVAAALEVWRSAHADAALAYREKRGLPREPKMGVVVQVLVDAMTAGVLFTRHPVTDAHERVVEASWGLGETVVSGLVTPDHYRLQPDGRLIEFVAGYKDLRLEYGPDGGTVEVEVPGPLRTLPCLQPADLLAVSALADRCETVYGADLDLEWAVSSTREVFLLQCRPITTTRATGR